MFHSLVSDDVQTHLNWTSLFLHGVFCVYDAGGSAHVHHGGIRRQTERPLHATPKHHHRMGTFGGHRRGFGGF